MKARIFALFIVVMAAVSSCSLLDFLVTGQIENIRIMTDTIDGVIFKATNAKQAGLSFEFNEPIIDYWTPSEADVVALEAGLPAFLRAEIPADHFASGIVDELERYKRQYFGITFEAGQPLIYANFFCAGAADYWLESLVIVMDGGECFFQVLYDPATAAFSDLRINGFA